MGHKKPAPSHAETTPGFRVRLPRPMLERLDSHVDRSSGETRSVVVRRALKAFLDYLERQST